MTSLLHRLENYTLNLAKLPSNQILEKKRLTFPSLVNNTVCMPPAQISTISCSVFRRAGRFFSNTSGPNPNCPQSPAPVTNTIPSRVVSGNFTLSKVTKTDINWSYRPSNNLILTFHPFCFGYTSLCAGATSFSSHQKSVKSQVKLDSNSFHKNCKNPTKQSAPQKKL